MTVIRKTMSLCPECLARIPADYVRRGKHVFLEKTCATHGAYSVVAWREGPEFEQWLGERDEVAAEGCPACLDECGLCAQHLQKTCCAVIEVTRRCNLNCRFCLAGEQSPDDPSLDEIKSWLRDLIAKGITFVHLSGGEPTVRADLPEIVRAAHLMGFEYIQLNTNGLALANDLGYVWELAEAGLSAVFLQYDGTTPEIYETIRCRDLLEIKNRAIENCSKCCLGVVLVPALVPGVNTDNIGDILRFALSSSPAVRGVHFQPVTYLGTYPHRPTDDARITLSELVSEIEQQTGGLIQRKNLLPSRCDHPLCGFHGDFIALPDRVMPLLEREDQPCCCGAPVPVEKNRNFVGRRWKRTPGCCGGEESDPGSLDWFLESVKSHGFTITAMAFQDPYTVDIDRLRHCSLHVYDRGRLIPFCARYM